MRPLPNSLFPRNGEILGYIATTLHFVQYCMYDDIDLVEIEQSMTQIDTSMCFCGQITLNKVLLVGTKTSTYIGKPIVPNATVHAIVEEQVRYSSGGVFLYLIFLFCALLL